MSLRIAIGYASLSIAWILLGDWVVALWNHSHADLALAQSVKGVAFVVATATLLAFFARRFERDFAATARDRDRQFEQLQALVAALPDLVFMVAADGTILRRLQTDGPSPILPDAEVVGRKVQEIIPAATGAQLAAGVAQVVADQRPTTISYTLPIAGETRWFRAHLRYLSTADCVLALIRDCTDERRAGAEQELAAMVFDNALSGIVVTDEHARIIAANPAFEVITGYSKAEILGRPISLLSSGRHDRAFYQRMWGAITANGQWTGEIWNRKKSGQVYPEYLSIRAVSAAKGAAIRYVGSFRDITDVKKNEDLVQRLTHEDPTTRLPNRAYISVLLNRLLANRAAVERATAEAGETWCGVLLSIDLEDFNKINAALGYEGGDVVLQEIAIRLVAATAGDDLVARIGADEFAIVSKTPHADHEAARYAAAVQHALQQTYRLGNTSLVLRCSIGIARIGCDGDNATDLLRNAETARRVAHRNRVLAPAFYRSETTETARRELELDGELEAAIAGDALELHYQPLVSGPNRTNAGVEALVRWRHANGTLIPPDAFIHRAEQTGQIRALGRWVLRRACRDLRTLLDEGLTLPMVAINVSPHEFRSPDLAGEVLAALSEYGIAPQCIELEITESALMDDVDTAAAQLKRLVDLGVHIAIDDFGTGYSSLATLRRFAVHKLKIDRVFIAGLPDDSTNSAICHAVVDLADAFGLQVLAEGVETQAQFEALQGLGCGLFQGYLFDRPLPLAQLRERLVAEVARG